MRVYEPLWGTCIERAINKAIDMVNRSKSKKAIVLLFNSTIIKVSHKKHPKAIAKFYDNERKRQSAEYRNSPEGKLAAREAEEHKQHLQSVADEALIKLDNLDFSDMNAIIGWLKQIWDASDHIDVDVKPQQIVKIFERHGFKPSVNCGDDFNGDDEENFARYLIGQALNNLKQDGFIYPVFDRLANDWREKFNRAA